MSVVTIGVLAKQAGVKLATVRYYERRGLLPSPPRTASGYRVYSADAARRLRFIRHAQELGFTLAEVEELLGLSSRKRSSAEVCAFASQKIATIDERIRSLRGLRKRLERLTNSCSKKGTVEDCAVMQELYS
jgi:MerR family transcriptional regulator, copper efflux regulator